MVERTRQVRGLSVPAFMYGTAWKEERTPELVRLALGAGFRAIDTANQRRHYFEAGVGEAIAKSGVPREELFVQTKFTYVAGQDHRLPYDPRAAVATQVAESFESSLEHLKTTYVDSYVLHGPSSPYAWTAADAEAWRAMEELVGAGKVRLLGVSNVSVEHLEALLSEAEVVPAFVQNRCFARTGWDREMRALCRERDIVYQGFSLLTANGRELASPAVGRLAEQKGRGIAEIVFRFAMQVGMLPLTGTTSEEHMREDLGAFDFELEPEEVALIERLG